MTLHQPESPIVSERLLDPQLPIKVVILGAGKGGTALLESFLNLPRIYLAGIADKSLEAPGLALARHRNIFTTQDSIQLIQQPDIHLIVDVTGDPAFSDIIHRHKHSHSEVLGGAASKLLWDIIQHESSMQTQLFQAEKLAAMGTFASGIAHDINNPLYVILAMAESIQEETAITTIHQHAASIHAAAKRIQHISQDITQYARASQSQEPSPVSIQETLDEALKIAKFATKLHEITVVKNYRDQVAVSAKPEELLQVFVNLLTNAIQAMDGQGILTVSVARMNGMVQIEISDTGKGIDEDHLQKIFEPFFTTKAPGKGTGLGLYNVRMITRKYRGDLTVKSVLEKGTTMTLVFPDPDPT